MASKNFSVELKGKSQLHESTIKLAGIAINIWSTDAGITWESKNLALDVTDTLDIYMSCKAMTGTGWKFIVKNVDSNKTIYDEQGETGEVLVSRGGERISNFSERITAVPI